MDAVSARKKEPPPNHRPVLQVRSGVAAIRLAWICDKNETPHLTVVRNGEPDRHGACGVLVLGGTIQLKPKKPCARCKTLGGGRT